MIGRPNNKKGGGRTAGARRLSDRASVQRYFLAPHVHLCVTDDHAVLLDLKRDKYVGVSPAQMNALAAAVEGWPASAVSSKYPAEEAVLATMLEAGMLTADAALGKPAKVLRLPRPESTLTQADLEYRPRVHAGHVLRILMAAVKARLALKWRPIAVVVSNVQERKRRCTADSRALDLDRARPLVEAFLYLRPLFFSVRDNCLFDSLALVDFLAHYGCCPTLTIGVQTGPFLAHSWVHEGEVVFNDTPDYVRRFTPILAI